MNVYDKILFENQKKRENMKIKDKIYYMNHPLKDRLHI